MIEFSEQQKRYIIRHDYRYTIAQLAKKMGVSGKDILECYSDMVDSGEYAKHKLPWDIERRMRNE